MLHAPQHELGSKSGSVAPTRLRLGARAVGWIESEVDAWIRQQIAASRGDAE